MVWAYPLRAEETNQDPLAGISLDDLASGKSSKVSAPKISADFTGSIIDRIGAGLNYKPKDLDVATNQVYAFLQGSFALHPRISVLTSVLFDDFLGFSEKTRGRWAFEVREAYGLFRLGKVELKAGQQLFSWGTVDVINPTDWLNPRDYNRIIDVETGYDKLGIPALACNVFAGPMQLNVIGIPFHVPSRLDIIGGNTSLLGYQFPLETALQKMRTDSQFEVLYRFLNNWVPDWQKDLQHLLDSEEFYNGHITGVPQNFTAPEAATRLMFTFGRTNFYAAYAWLWDDLPTFYMNPKLTGLLKGLRRTEYGYGTLPPSEYIDVSVLTDPFAAVYHRSHRVGVAFATSVKGFGIRGEAAFIDPYHWYDDNFEPVARSQTSWAFNLDYLFSDELLLGVIYSGYAISDFSKSLLAEPSYHTIMITVRKPFLQDRLELRLAGLLDLTYVIEGRPIDSPADLDCTAYGTLIYNLTNNVKIGGGFNLFGGPLDTNFGYLRERSRIFTHVEFGF